MEKVTIITPVYNGAEYIENCMRQILSQSYQNIEHIIVNDGSIDLTKNIILSYENAYKSRGVTLKYLEQENMGIASAIKKALDYIEGAYIYLFDCDDSIDNCIIEKLVNRLGKAANCNVVRCYIKVVENHKIKRIIGATDNTQSDYEDNYFENLVLAKTNNYCGAYMIKSKPLLDYYKTHKFYDVRGGQNLQILLPVAYKSRCILLHEPLFEYNIHPNSHSHGKKKKLDYSLEKGYKDIRIHMINEIVDDIEYLKSLTYQVNMKYLYVDLVEAYINYDYLQFKLIYKQIKNKSFKRKILFVTNSMHLNKVVIFLVNKG